MRLLTTFIVGLLCLSQSYSQNLDVQIQWIANGCGEMDSLVAQIIGLEAEGEILGGYNYKSFNHFCSTAPDTLSGTVEIYEKLDGSLAFTDFSFGLWTECYGIDPPTGSLNFDLENNMITPLNGTDNYGDQWSFDVFAYSNNMYMITYSNTYGEFASAILEPSDGRMIPDLSGGMPSGNYTYLWSNGEETPVITFDGQEGMFSLIVSDENGNTGMASVDVEYNNPALDALEEFYRSTNGDNWTSNAGWKEYMDGNPSCGPCFWEGISCDQFDNIIGITLDENNLEGDVGDILTLIPDISNIILNFNNLYGSIPAEIGDLEFLNILSLFGNQIEGEIPSSLGDIPFLGTLNLGSNNLTGGIPSELGNFNFMFILNLEGNQLSGEIPQSFVGLDVIRLNLGFNNLTGTIPMPIGSPDLLRSFSAPYNFFSGELEDMWEEYERLSFVGLDHNQFTGELPATLLNNESIQSLYLSHNNFSGCYPTQKFLDPCMLEFNDQDTLIEINGELLSVYNQLGYNFTNNPLLPWQGDYEKHCDGEDQLGAPCDDGDPMTVNDIIQNDCSCAGEIDSAVRDLDGITINIYPNPVEGALFVQTENRQNLRAELVNAIGQHIQKIDLNVVNNIEYLDAGVYFLCIQNEQGGKIVEKLIKQ